MTDAALRTRAEAVARQLDPWLRKAEWIATARGRGSLTSLEVRRERLAKILRRIADSDNRHAADTLDALADRLPRIWAQAFEAAQLAARVDAIRRDARRRDRVLATLRAATQAGRLAPFSNAMLRAIEAEPWAVAGFELAGDGGRLRLKPRLEATLTQAAAARLNAATIQVQHAAKEQAAKGRAAEVGPVLNALFERQAEVGALARAGLLTIDAQRVRLTLPKKWTARTREARDELAKLSGLPERAAAELLWLFGVAERRAQK
jgi:hypothetical protein